MAVASAISHQLGLLVVARRKLVGAIRNSSRPGYRRTSSVADEVGKACITSSSHCALADASLVDCSQADTEWDNGSAVVYPNVISAAQDQELLQILTQRFRRRRYEPGHWDSAIQNYRETELFEEDESLQYILKPIRQFIEDHHGSDCGPNKVFTGTWLPCHAIDLHEDGQLNAHVDSVRFSGNLVAGLSLASSSIMRLKPSLPEEGHATKLPSTSDSMAVPKDNNHPHFVDLFLPPRSLYVLSGDSRYYYTHELLPSGSPFGGDIVTRSRRLSVIFRDAKADDGAH